MQALPTNYNFKNLIGNKYGRLVVIEYHGQNKNKSTMWKCQCDCGEFAICIGANLSRGNSKSCGCLNQELRSHRKLKHGMFGTKFYGAWAGMFNRCTRKACKDYENYGGRGITVCDRWKDFDSFKSDMYESFNDHVNLHGNLKTSLDREDVNGNYEPSNCRWATPSVQASNRRDKNESTKVS